jgi:hypothetical protein
MKIIRTICVAIIFVAFVYLIFSHAITIIYLLSSVIAVVTFVSYVLLHYQKYIDEENEPKKIILVGNPMIGDNQPYKDFEDNYNKLKFYFENRYVAYPTRIIYFFHYAGNKPHHSIYVSIDNDKIFKRIEEGIKVVFGEQEVEIIRGLPTV